jgi:peptidoglycan biosynthesis protein MviN/MurJ (putative lipid II flippase)
VFRQATFAYMLGLPAYLSGQVLVRLVILEGRGRLLNVTAIAQLLVNVAADLVLGSVWGITGVALATSLVTWVGWGLFWFLCRNSFTGSIDAAASIVQSVA